MDDELRELEQAGQKAVSAVSKVTNYTEQMLQTLLNASGKTLGFAGKQVKKANDIERERHRAKKAEKGSEVKVSDKISGSKSHLESFNFTGKRTDLCYFANTDRMPLSAINNIPDRELKDKVVETFNELCSKKYGCVKIEGDELVITDKGKKMLQDGTFKKQAMNDQLEAYGKQFENTVLKNIEGWFTSFSGTNVSTGTFNFNMEDFVNQFSQIFVIFASSLLVILFGINIIKTALEYQLFTLKGAVSVFGQLILAEIWIQLSTKICVMVVKIFNELMASILAAVDSSGLLKMMSLTFESSRSGVWLIGDLVDFFANLCPFLLIILLIGIVLVIFLIVYVKLIIRTLELSMLAVVSPVFFACSVGEATMPYFRKFITAFLSVGAEIIFMGIVYLAFLWYCQGVNLTEVSIADLYNFSSTSAGTFYTYIAVTVACGVMMIKPPQVLRDLMR